MSNNRDIEMYLTELARLVDVMPQKKLQKHVAKWLNDGLTVTQKLFEVRLLLVVWDEDKRIGEK